jgi:TM2 domain-containing membrane protein YozV
MYMTETMEVQQTPKKNKQATNSLVLGIVSTVFSVGNFLPGLLSVLSIVSALAGLFAILSGFSGLRAARKMDGFGRQNAVIGMILGLIGILALVIMMMVSVNKGVNYAKSLNSSTVFKGEGYSFSYPGSWTIQDMSGQAFCQNPVAKCAITLVHPSKDGTNLNLFIMQLNQEYPITDLDQKMWAEVEAATPGIKLESRQALRLGEITAIQRIFSQPSPVAANGIAHIQQVYITKGQYLYNFTLWSPTAEALKKYSPEANTIIASFAFTK